MKTPLIALALVIPRFLCAVISFPNEVRHVEDVQDRQLPGRWSQELGHPVHALFRRAPGDGISYAPVGTPGEIHCYTGGIIVTT